MGTLHRTVRATFAGWILKRLAGAGAPMTPAVSMSVAGWLAYTEEVVLSWLDQRQMPRAELIDLCERSCYQLVAAAMDDPSRFEEVRAAVERRP
ncbi:hypothetical protein NGB36_02585 [Streptomyces sp. RB6PN25]|uniref:Uncharacterized protein n=1 Tax=Streptomyces humicola TaxID=2953240 RepID=A0ABT1PPC3_9ACTN|nr:hypothetical protein [Streptomyces humicola]MCQ4079513.1 hypothetical protein [Streptomyces humicola]